MEDVRHLRALDVELDAERLGVVEDVGLGSELGSSLELDVRTGWFGVWPFGSEMQGSDKHTKLI